MVDPRLYCTHCHACMATDTNICSKWELLGLSSNDGDGYSEYAAINEDMCYVRPDSEPLSEAALIEHLTVARHAARSSGFNDYQDKTILILSGGPVGLAAIICAGSKRRGKLIVSVPTTKRPQQTAQFVDAVLDPRKEKVLKDGMDALRRGGTYVNCRRLGGRRFYTAQDFKETVDDWIAGKFKGLGDVVTKGLEKLVNNKDDHVKILVTPPGTL
ncbi:uncharacterized protein Z518_06494 [Rhinocladiella mackenziei CBS 650.93]|uniref:Alcohol dehydrogenase-like C-terminal domain-containing protein n=1 Tax=Rhinocladiella mackenziei CBS 650.93 TaxID=1442369 RepID=A0A0D2IAT6_9EURO|nr:uncharacterized protein Z518_06494 [Rhinocladiella mackenziei CBS 650.93]KIX02944.1 hypothetical protein Z518_06494 [Rhinocladiella mackenziei CBS 650.93]